MGLLTRAEATRAIDVQGAPPRLDHGVRERQFREGQDPAQHSRGDQVIDLGVHILHAGIRQYDRGGVWGAAARLASSSTVTLFTGANVSTTRHAKMRREKLSITAWR